jgi:hypothetical protein
MGGKLNRGIHHGRLYCSFRRILPRRLERAFAKQWHLKLRSIFSSQLSFRPTKRIRSIGMGFLGHRNGASHHARNWLAFNLAQKMDGSLMHTGLVST